MSTASGRLAAVGDNCVDWYAQRGVGHAGGNPVNVAVNHVRDGGQASYTGVVGDDEAGALLRAEVADRGVDVTHLRTAPGRTAVTQVTLVGGDRVFGDYDEGVMADFRLTDEDIDFICGHDLVATGLWGKIEPDLPIMRARGVPVAYDCADQLERDQARSAIPHTDICFFSAAGDAPEVRDTMRAIAAQGPSLVVATLGSAGSLGLHDGEIVHVPVTPVRAVDTMGAGDSFIGAFLHGHLLGEDLQQCMERGTRSAAVTLGIDGAW